MARTFLIVLSALAACLSGCGAPGGEHPAPPLVLGSTTVASLGIPYAGEGASARRADVYAPRGAQGAPVVLFVHGGGWTRGDRGEVGSQPKLFNDRGILLVSIDYRLSPEHRHPAHVDDVAAAVAWARSTIGRYGGDGRKLVVMGHSAGSHLAALVATDPRPLSRQGLRLSDLRGVVSLDGSAFDIVERIEKGGEKLAENCRRAFGADRASHEDASPLRHVAKGSGGPPFLLVYVKDGSLNHSQSRTFADRVRETGGRAQLLHVGEKTHFTLANDLGTSQDSCGDEIVRFIRTVTSE